MIDWTKPVIRIGNGAPARVLCTDGPEPYSVAVWPLGTLSPISLTRDGRYLVNGPAAFANAPEPEAEPQQQYTLMAWESGWTAFFPGHGPVDDATLGRYFHITIPAPGKEPTIVEAK